MSSSHLTGDRMRGTIILLKSRDEGLLESADLYYTFKLDGELADKNPQTGDQAEFDIIKPNTKYYGVAKILSIKPLCEVSDEIVLSRDEQAPGYEVVEIKGNITFVSEGKCAEQCIYEYENEVKKYNANALLNVRYEAIRRPLNKTYLSRYTGNLAQVKGGNFAPPAGLKIAAKEDMARPNYASEAFIRQTRVLLCALLLVLIPCMMALSARDVLDYKIANNIIFAAVILFIFYGYKLNPRGYRTYLKRKRHGLF